MVCSKLFLGALGREGVHELGEADAPVQLVSVESPQETLQLYLGGVLVAGGLLAQLGCLVEVAFEVAAELARGQEPSLEPVELIEDGSQRHWHALFYLLSDAFDHAFGVDESSEQLLEEHV